MNITFKYRRLAKSANSVKESNCRFGPEVAKKYRQRLNELKAAETLEDMMTIQSARCHELKGNLKGQFAVCLKEPMRLIFEPDHNPLPLNKDGGLDLKRINRICILTVRDYH